MRSETMTDRELDAAVAEKVMGYRWYMDRDDEKVILAQPTEYFEGDDFLPVPSEEAWSSTRRDIGNAPPYSRDIAAAWTVVEKMRERGWLYHVGDNKDGHVFQFGRSEWPLEKQPYKAIDPSFCRAAVLSALAAVKGEGEHLPPSIGMLRDDDNDD